MACVVSVFLGGLGLGAYAYTRLKKRVAGSMLAYAAIEFSIAAFAFLVPWFLQLADHATSALYYYTTNQGALRFALNLVMVILAIGPPCVLMGTTLPLLISFLVRTAETKHVPIAWLYAINTLGAAVGCLTAGFFFLPEFGFRGTSNIGVMINGGIALFALCIARQFQSGERADISRVPVEKSTFSRPDFAFLAISTALGASALILQVIWTRWLTVLLGGSTYAFTAILFTVLLGIAIGSVIVEIARWRDSPKLPLIISMITMTLVVSAVLGKHLVPQLASLVGALKPLRADQFLNAGISVAVSSVVQFLPSLMSGMLFPLYIFAIRLDCRQIDSGVGYMYAFNTIGAIIGACAATNLLIPSFGTTVTAMVALNLVCFALYLYIDIPHVSRDRGLMIVFAISVIAVFCIGKRNDPRATDSGKFMYGFWPANELRGELLYFKEGKICDVMVTEVGETRALRVNGKVDAGDGADMPTQFGFGLIPMIMKPDSTNIAVIGFGSGTTCGACLLFPHVNVKCCEIEESIVAASSAFSHVNFQPLKSGRLSLVYDDARAFLKGDRQHYDLILSEPSNPWIAGVSGLFTREFYSSTTSRMTSGGLFVQWIQAYSLNAEQYRAIVSTIKSVFPHAVLVRVSDGDTMVVASLEPIRFTSDVVGRSEDLIQANEKIRSAMMRYFKVTNSTELLLSTVVLDNDGVDNYLAAANKSDLITDSNLSLEYDAPKSLFSTEIGSERQKIWKEIYSAVDDQVFREISDIEYGKKIESLLPLITRLETHGHREGARRLIEFGLTADSRNIAFLMKKIQYLGAKENAERDELIAYLVDADPIAATRVGVTFWEAENYTTAIGVYEALVERYPTSSGSHANLAVNYEAVGMLERAKLHAEKAESLDPADDFAQRMNKRIKDKVKSSATSESAVE